MARRPAKRPSPEVIELMERWMAAAYRGDLRDVVIVGRFADGEYDDDWRVDDLQDMAVELRSTVIRVASDAKADEPEPVEH